MSLNLVAAIGIILMVLLLLLGMNIGLSMFLVGFLGYAVVVGFQPALGVLMSAPMTSALGYSLTVIPLFVLMGQFAYYSGISTDLFETSNTWFGRVRGGVAMATVAACALFGAICGSLPATIATMGVVAYPEMKKHGYAPTLSTGIVASGGTLGTLIPPSTAFILYGIIAEQNISKLFAAGVLPGILMAVCFIAVIIVLIIRDPSIAPAGERYTMLQKLKSLKGCVGMVLLFAVVIGGMFAGWFSATEAAAIGAFVAFLFLALRKRATWSNIKASLEATVKTLGMCMLIVLGAFMFGYFLAVTQLPMSLANWVAGLSLPPMLIMIVIILLYAFMGCIMDAFAMTLLTVPIFLPIVTMLGYDPIWFGVIMVMVQNIGALTPPVGSGAYVAAGTIKEVPLTTVFRGIIPFLFAFLLSFVLVVLFPQIATWLPSILKF